MMDGDVDSEKSASLRNPEQTSLEDALVEARRWIENVTGMKFHSNDFRKSMTDGILLCMLMQKIKPGLIKKINKSRSIYAGVDNLNVFLGACEELGLKAAKLFHPGDLQDLSSRASLSVQDKKKEEERRLKSVCITIFWLGRTANQLESYAGPHLSLDAFAPLIHGSSSLVKGLHVSPDNASSGVSSWASGTSANNNNNFRSSQGYHDDVFTPDGIDLTSIAPERYTEPQWKRDLRRELDSSVPGLSDYTDSVNTGTNKPVLRMDGSSRRRPPPVAAKPLHARSKSMPERSSLLERQNSVEDEDSQSYRSGSSGDPMSPTTYDEFVKGKGMMQEDREVWMSMADTTSTVVSVQRSLDSWKSRRRRATHSALERKASREEVEQTEQSRQRRRSKTYQEMMQEKEKREKILMKMATKNKSLDAEDIVHILTKPSLYEEEIQDVPERGQGVGREATQSYRRVDGFTDLRPGHVEPMTFREKLLRDRDREVGLSAQQRDSKSSARLPQKKRLSLGIMGRVAAFNKGEGEEEHMAKPQPPKPAPKPEPEYTELIIKMKQRPRNEDGFGFTIFGGADSGRSIVVTSITPGSTAEQCELNVGDEIVAINGETTKLVTYDHALYCFSSSVLDGELTLSVYRYEDLGKRARSTTSTRSTERNPATSDPSEFSKRRAVSQPTDPRNMSQAARARKILEQMREEEQRMEDLRREREEERMGVAVNGNQNWNHSDNKPDPLRAYYNEPEEIESDGEMFSSEEEARMEEEIINRMQEEQQAEDEAEARHHRVQEDEQNKSPIDEDFITSQTKQAEEAPISFQSIPSEASEPVQFPLQRSENPPSSTNTSVDGSKPPKYHPVKFTTGPKPFSNRRGPEPYKPPSFKPVSVKDSRPDVKQDMLKRRSDFFNDERDLDNRSGQSSPVVGESVTAEVQQPIEAAIEPQVREATESFVRSQPKQPASLASRKTFNVEEEKKRLERWHAEQERIRQEQYEQEQRRLQEQQEKDLERAELEERKRKTEEQQRLSEKQKILQEQAAEERKRHEEERNERMRKKQAYLERARLEREAAEQERLKDEEEQQKMAAERKMREEERLRKEEKDRKKKEAERKAEREAQRQREEEELHRQELERQDQEAEERRIEINRLREKEAEERARRKKEEERLAEEQEKKERERFARLREEEIERIRVEEREKLRKEWEELQREKDKHEERERVERERLEELRAEQERLRQERIKLEKQQEEERQQLQREKEHLLAQSTNGKPDADKIPYSQSDKNPDVIDKDSHYGEYIDPVREKEIIVSEEKKDVYSAPPQNNNDSYKVPGQAYMSLFKDGSMGNQHWMVEEAERRRLAEKTRTSRPHNPVEVHSGPILRQDLDLEPVLEKRNYAPEQVAPVRHTDKQVSPEPTKMREQDVRQHPVTSQNPKDQPYREVAVDVPPDFQPVRRRSRPQEVEAEKKKKQNRQSMPDVGNRVPDVVRNDVHGPPVPPHGSNRNGRRMPESISQVSLKYYSCTHI